jgi:hypothetical protein
MAAILLGIAAYSQDTKWVVAVSAFCIVSAICAAESRLYDLCIRQRRTNIPLSRQGSA